MKLGNLVVEISADSAKFIAGAADTEIKLDNLGKRARSAVNTFGKYSAAATGAGLALATYLVTNSINSAKEMRVLANVSNTTVKRFNELAYGAKQFGIENDKLADIFKDMNDRVGDFVATGGGPMADFFEKIAPKVGVTADQFRKLSGPDALQLYVSSLEKANLSQQDMTFFMEALASDSTNLLPLLRNNGAEFARQAEEARKLGLAINDIEAEQISRASTAIDTMGQGIDAAVTKFSAQLSPVLVAIGDQFNEAAKDAGGFGNIALNTFETVINAISFVVDAIDGIKRVFDLTADGIITAMAWVSQRIASRIALVLAALSTIPGVDFSETLESLQTFSEDANKIIDESVNNMDETLSKPLAGEQFRQFVDDARKAGEEAAKAAVEARAGVTQPSGGTTGVTMTPEQEARKKQLEQQIEAIRLANMEEMDILNKKQQQELEALREFYEGKNSLRTEFAELEKETLARHEEEKSEIEKRASEIRKRQADEEAKYKQQALATALSNLTSLMNSENRKMFEIGKAAALSQAVIDGYASIVGAYKVGAGIGGPALGAAYGAAAALATSQQINAIRSQSFGGGGGTSGSTTQAVNAQTTPVSTQSQQPAQTMTVSGIDEGELFSGGRVRNLVGELLEYQRNGGTIILA